MTFKNDASQAERKAFVKDTFHSRTHDESGGRWQKQTPTNVIGSSPVSYPRLPASSPWANDPVPPEEPLGIDVTEAPIVGESFEVEQSLNAEFAWRKTIRDGAPDPSLGSSLPDDVGAPDVVAAPTSSRPNTSSTSLSKPRTASEDGATNSSQSGRGSAPSSNFNIKRRLR
jgi:hypothetical protein